MQPPSTYHVTSRKDPLPHEGNKVAAEFACALDEYLQQDACYVSTWTARRLERLIDELFPQTKGRTGKLRNREKRRLVRMTGQVIEMYVPVRWDALHSFRALPGTRRAPTRRWWHNPATRDHDLNKETSRTAGTWTRRPGRSSRNPEKPETTGAIALLQDLLLLAELSTLTCYLPPIAEQIRRLVNAADRLKVRGGPLSRMWALSPSLQEIYALARSVSRPGFSTDGPGTPYGIIVAVGHAGTRKVKWQSAHSPVVIKLPHGVPVEFSGRELPDGPHLIVLSIQPSESEGFVVTRAAVVPVVSEVLIYPLDGDGERVAAVPLMDGLRVAGLADLKLVKCMANSGVPIGRKVIWPDFIYEAPEFSIFVEVRTSHAAAYVARKDNAELLLARKGDYLSVDLSKVADPDLPAVLSRFLDKVVGTLSSLCVACGKMPGAQDVIRRGQASLWRRPAAGEIAV